jgi:mannan endo-1,4-beta-mannosidase
MLWRRLLALLALNVVTVLLAACTNGARAGSTVASPSAAPARHGDVYFGFSPRDWPTSFNEVDRFEQDAGKHLAIIDIYEDWADEDPPTDVLAKIHNHGSTPMITWQPKKYGDPDTPDFPLAKIAAGDYDARITRFARDLAALHYPIFLRFAHEMNGDGYPWIVGTFGQTASDYVNAWRHVHDLFLVAGASNVVWVWNPMYESSHGTSFASIFPGDAYVDWVGLDGYNGGTRSGDWRSFSTIFSAAYQALTMLSSRPVMIGETASDEAGDGGAMKAAWIRDMLETAIPSMPRIKALLWYNVNEAPRDWQIESSMPAQIAFAMGIAAPRYLATYP